MDGKERSGGLFRKNFQDNQRENFSHEDGTFLCLHLMVYVTSRFILCKEVLQNKYNISIIPLKNSFVE